MRSTIIQLGRAIASALSPLTGERAYGQLVLRAQPGSVVTIEPFESFIPIIDGARIPQHAIKVPYNPQDARGCWTVGDVATVLPALSNLGGVRFNFPKDTRFGPEIPIDGLMLDPQNGPKALTDFEGGKDPHPIHDVQDVVFYEAMEGPDPALDIRRMGARGFPLLVLAFDDMTQADGIAVAQIGQQATLGGSLTRMFAVSYTISIVVSRTEGEFWRKHQGLVIADRIAELLNNRNAADEHETLSSPSGLQIRQLIRENGQQDIYQKFYIYTFSVSAMRAITRVERKMGNPWLRTVFSVDKPQIPAEPNQGTIRVVNEVEIDMTPDQLDLVRDGIFTRASTATLWDGVTLYEFQSGERRVLQLSDGIYLEPAITNPLGPASKDLSLWTALVGATVLSTADKDPLGQVGGSFVALFGADPASGLELSGMTVTVGQPVMFQVFARSADGSKQTLRLVVDDGLLEHEEEFTVGGNWERLRFECTPESTSATVRLQNKAAGGTGKVSLWGACIDNAARWGAEFTGTTKAKESLVFLPPSNPVNSELDTPRFVLTGKWSLEFVTPSEVPTDMTATGLPYKAVLAAAGNGTTDLFRLCLYGTPNSGGATLELWTRGAGLAVSLTGLQWRPGEALIIETDAAAGTLHVAGLMDADVGDAVSFPPYASSADLQNDYLVIGDSSNGSAGPVPGFYTVVANGRKVLG